MLNDEIIAKADKLASIKKEMETLKNQAAEIEGFFLKRAEEDLADTKLKSVEYAGYTGKVVATMAQSLKMVYPTFLKQVFGDAYKDVVIEETKYKVNANATRMLSGLWLRNYSEMRIQDVVSQIEVDDKTRAVLLKKLKGTNFKTDKKNLIAIAGLNEKAAEEYAYFISESAVYESFMRLMKAINKDDEQQVKEALDLIDGAVIVEENPKITVEW
ncbi:MAG: hypothetical protein IJX07_06205 [Bacillales bacterium]|nr:hypothetical protein [Bacillales bacterium]